MKLNFTKAFSRDIYALFFVRLVVSAGSFVNPFLAMLLTMKLGYGEARAGAFMSAVSVVSAGGMLLGGKLGDALGRRTTLATLQALTAGCFFLCAIIGFAPVTPFIIAFALGSLSGSWPVINAVVADAVAPERRKQAFALLYWGNNIGFSVGPLAAGFLFARAPRLLFVGNATAICAAACIILIFVRETHPLKLEDPAPAVPGKEAAASPPGPGAREGTLRVLFRDPTLVLFSLLSILTAFVYNQHVFALPIFLKDVLGAEAGPKAFGAAMAANGLTVVVCTAAVTAASRKLPSLLAAASGSVLYAIGFGSYALANGLPFVLVCTFVWTLGEILGATNTNAFIAERAPASHRSRINSAVSFCYIIGNALAPLAAGSAMKAVGSKGIWVPIGVLSALGALGLAALYGSDRHRGPGKAAQVF